MSGFRAFLAKEVRETRRTWRLWVIPGILVFFGVTSPVLAAVTPALLRATAERSPGVVLQFPPPTAADAYLQYLGNLAQVALLAVIIAGAACGRSSPRRRSPSPSPRGRWPCSGARSCEPAGTVSWGDASGVAPATSRRS